MSFDVPEDHQAQEHRSVELYLPTGFLRGSKIILECILEIHMTVIIDQKHNQLPRLHVAHVTVILWMHIYVAKDGTENTFSLFVPSFWGISENRDLRCAIFKYRCSPYY